MWQRLQSLADKDVWLGQDYDPQVSADPGDPHFSLSLGGAAFFVVGLHPGASQPVRGFRQWRWHLDEIHVKLNGKMVYLLRAVDQEGEMLESYITKNRDKKAALTFMKKALKHHGSPEKITTDGLRSYRAAMNKLGNADKKEIGRHASNRAENSHLPFRKRGRAMLRFRRMKTLQKFASVHANVHNHLASPPFGSTRNATSSIDKPTRNAARPHSPSGSPSWAEPSPLKPRLRQSETSCD